MICIQALTDVTYYSYYHQGKIIEPYHRLQLECFIYLEDWLLQVKGAFLHTIKIWFVISFHDDWTSSQNIDWQVSIIKKPLEKLTWHSIVHLICSFINVWLIQWLHLLMHTLNYAWLTVSMIVHHQQADISLYNCSLLGCINCYTLLWPLLESRLMIIMIRVAT